MFERIKEAALKMASDENTIAIDVRDAKEYIDEIVRLKNLEIALRDCIRTRDEVIQSHQKLNILLEDGHAKFHTWVWCATATLLLGIICVVCS